MIQTFQTRQAVQRLTAVFQFTALLAMSALILQAPQAAVAQAKKGAPAKANETSAANWSAIDAAFLDLNPEKALELTTAALKTQPQNQDLLWRHSRALVGTADRMKDKTKQLATYEEAKSVAEQVITANPQNMYGYLRRAIAAGKIALFKGVLETRELVLLTRNDAQKAIELNNAGTYELGLAYYLLGRVHLKLSETPKVMRMPLGLGWGTVQEAETHLSKAVATFPDSPGFHVDYAKALIKLEKASQAKQELQKATSLKPLDASDVERIQEAKDLLKSL
ncbi:MAG: tetratricopeptide repeat protein [Bdellovibrionales bacterium]